MNIARYIVAFVALYGFGGFLFDAIIPVTARQHLWNPRWPPHAKFHNAQTMLFGIFNAVLTVAILFGIAPLTPQLFLIAVAVAASYWITLIGAPLFPGTAWCDPEFVAVTPHPLGLSPQALTACILLGLLAMSTAFAIASG